MQETWVQSLGWEDPLEKRMATSSSILAWRIPWTEEPGRLQSIGWVGHNWATISYSQPHMRKRSENLFVRDKKTFKELSLSYSSRHSHQLSPIIKLLCKACVYVSSSVLSNSLQPHGLGPTRLLCPWNSPGKNTGVGCHFLLQCMKVKSESEVTQSCLALLDPMDSSLPGSSVHGIFQARVLEWVAILFSKGSSQPSDWTQVSCIAGRFFAAWATMEAHL